MTERPLGTADSGQQAAEPSPEPDPGLRGVDYAGISPLTLPVEALLRAIKALSKLFWISMIGTLLTIFLASLAHVGGAVQGSVSVGEYSIPVSVLPIGCLVFAWFMLWLTAARLRMLDGALGDDDLTATLAREVFRLDPPVLDVFEAGNLRPLALLSGSSMLLWNWSLFFGSSVGLFFSAIIVPGCRRLGGRVRRLLGVCPSEPGDHAPRDGKDRGSSATDSRSSARQDSKVGRGQGRSGDRCAVRGNLGRRIRTLRA